MTEADQNQLIAQVARGIIVETALQELPLFRANSELFFKNPGKALAQERGQEEMLGFGPEVALVLLTPVVMQVVSDVVKFLGAEIAKSAEKESTPLIDDAVKRLFKVFQPKDPQGAKTTPTSAAVPVQPPLTADEIKEVRQLAFDKARELELPEPKAKLLADAIVGSLVTA